MEEYMQFSAKTKSEAITKACMELGVSSDQLDITVVSEGSSGFFGIGSKPAVIKARRKAVPDEEQDMKEILDSVKNVSLDSVEEKKKEQVKKPEKKAQEKQSVKEKKEKPVEKKEKPVEKKEKPVEKKEKPAEKKEKPAEKKEKSVEKKEKPAEKQEKSVEKQERKEKTSEKPERKEKSSVKQERKEKSSQSARETASAEKRDLIDTEFDENTARQEKQSKDHPEKEKQSKPVEILTDEAEIREIEERARVFLKDVFASMDLGEVDIKSVYNREDGSLDVDFEGEDMGVLIGKRGQTLDSLQYLTSLVVNKNKDKYIRVKLDTEDYRRRRKETLENLAKGIAYKVKKTRKQVVLEPMNPYERRIIHSVLQSNKYVETVSEGEEPYRHIVVKLKKNWD